MVKRLIDIYCRLLDSLIAILLAIMVVLVFGNVVLRYAFNSGITVSEEMSRWLFVWLTFLGAIAALKEYGHLGTDMLLVKLPPKAQRPLLVLSNLLMLYMTWLLFQGSLEQAKINYDVEAPVTGASVAIFYASGIVFAVSAAVILLDQLWDLVTGKTKDEDLVKISESEDLAMVEGLHHGDDQDPHVHDKSRSQK
jgi:TRAP-type C4-dicarboxylate transport system permease small subunit